MSTTTTGVNSTNSTNSTTSTKSTKDNKSLDKDAFLKLLTTQLQNQDPMNPMQDTEYIAQLAQFSSLEQMTNTNTNLQSIKDLIDSNMGSLLSNQSAFSSISLIGKKVDYIVTNSETNKTTTESGTVNGIEFKDGVPALKIGDKEVSISNVTKVS
ncbi:MAG: flagellar hook capping FlgD N-terminal domain-containing protein [Armatimonadota bacterium]